MAIFVQGTLCPALLLAARALALRRLPPVWRLGVDLLILMASVPLSAALIGRAIGLPKDAGDHSPGVGVVFAPLVFVWLICLLIWLVRLATFGVRRLRTNEPS